MDLLSNGEYVKVETLSRELYVSMPTIRRDLTEMQKMGLVVRSHGGVVKKFEENDGTSMYFRSGVNSGAKQRLADAAANMLKDNITIFVDESTTALRIISHIPNYKNIYLITNSVSVLNLAIKYRINTYCLGGKLNYDCMSLHNLEAESVLDGFGIDIMFFSSSSITQNAYIADYSEESTLLRRKALNVAQTKVFLCDSSKFEKSGTFILAPLSKADYVITDCPLPEKYGYDSTKVIIV